MFKALGGLVLGLWLSGCAVTQLDANVHSQGVWPAGRTVGGFAFERLPSQMAFASEQDRLEAQALPALERAGFRLVERSAADALVQVAARTLQGQVVYADPFVGPYWGGGWYGGWYGSRWRGGGWGYGPGWGWGGWGPAWANSYPYYAYEVSVLILDARSQQALYETRARSDGAWPDDVTWSALYEAAMRDFPYNAVSPRLVRIQLDAATPTAAPTASPAASAPAR